MKRRALLGNLGRLGGAVALSSSLASTLAGCGFELRRSRPLPFARVTVIGFADASPMGMELRRAIEGAGTTRIVELKDAQVVLRVLLDARQRVVAGSGSAGQVRELTLRTRLRFRLTAADEERVLIPDTELVQSRDMSFTETTALAKQQESELLYRAMQADIVDQVMRRLAAVVL